MHDPGAIMHSAHDSELLYSQHISQLEVEGVAYDDIKVFENLNEIQNIRVIYKVYHARHVGVIRKELYNGQVWNLKRYFINK
jgi:hypothetical protein